jgi:hypothetical protein
MSLEFSGEIWQWRGPAPYYFVTVPAQECEVIKTTAKLASYGWGMIPVKVRIGKTEWQTSLLGLGDLRLQSWEEKTLPRRSKHG